ncbi:filamentous hemagglutinin [Pseudomonas asplenii]|uniref:Filamentous hemagglutinin n=1 Tax=Pseudomonas asplenii TaxID=53407 RepID=A0A1H1ZR35_9PSED|nr:filamentous hemagglutinin [Pseudomonas asplenii]
MINQNGTLIADGAILLAADSLDNSQGAISGKSDITATVASLNNQNGQLITQGNLGLTGGSLDNRQNGLVGATKALKLKVDQIDNRAGELSSNADIHITASRLDNRDGGKVLAETSLTLNSAQVLNGNLGLLKGKTGLSLDGQTLDNTHGLLISGQDSRLTLTGDLDNSQGLISSEGQLDVSAAKLSNTAGSLSSAGTLTANASTALVNQGGRLVSDSSITVNSASLDNSAQGMISGKGAVGVTTGAFDNSAGSLTSADSLTLTAGQVSNQGGRIGSDKALTASVMGLDQQGGKLFSNSALTLDLNHGQLNNQNGLINAPSLILNNLKGVNNQGGEISSAQAFTLAADSLDNNNGKLLSNQAVTLRVNQALTNLKGLIAAAALDVRAASLDNASGTLTSRSNLDLTTTGQLGNQAQGLINAAQALTINSGDLNNQGGTLLGKTAVTLNAMALNNSANGLINSQSGLSINATHLDSSNGGEVSAKGDIVLALTGVTQNGGRLLGDQAITVGLTGGDLDNRNGLLNAKGPLTLTNLRDLNNQNGELSSSQSFNVVGRNLDNSNGKLISNNRLGVTGSSLVNQGGLISGWQGLSVTGASLDNRNGGTLSSRNGNLDVTLSGALLNGNMGALVSQQTLTVNADSLDNSAGILSSGAEQKLTVAGLLNNIQGGSIDSGAGLTLQAMALNNAGSISAQQAIGFTGTRLDNSAGTLTGNGAVTLDLLGALINNSGKLASAGPLVISRSSQISNQGGQLVSQGLLSLLTGSLDNSNRGTVAANGNLQITSTGAVQNNADGLIYSQNGDLTVNAASLANGKGSLQGQGALSLTVAGDIDNQSGKLIAQNGNLTASAANLDNRGGTLSSLKGALETRIVGVLKNGYDLNNNRQGGIIQGQRLNLSALGGIDNYGGRISAQSGDTLITTADFDNRNGGVYAKGLVQVTGNNFDNSGDNDGQIAGQRIDLSLNGALNNRLGIIESDSTLSVRAASLDNQTGQLRALGTSGKTDFQIGGLFDNSNGKLETANSDLTLNVGGFQNQGGSLQHGGVGTFDIATANLLNAGGNVVTRGGLTLTMDNWTNSSVIQAGRLTLNIGTLNQTAGGQLLAVDSLTGSGGNWNNDGLIASDGTASLNLSGSYGGNGRYSTQGTLGLNAASVSLGSAGSIAGGGDTAINVGGQLTNQGRMTSISDLIITADTVHNIGTLAASKALVISTRSLLNDHAIGDINNSGFVFSGEDSTFNVGSLTNNYGEFFSLGGMTVGGLSAGTAAQSLRNTSGRIQSTGDMTLAVGELLNEREKFSAAQKLTSVGVSIRCVQHCSGGWSDRRPELTLTRTVESVVDENSPSATLSAGRNLSFTGTNFTNRYSLVSATNDLSIQSNNILNQAALSAAGTDSRVVTANPKVSKAQYNQMVQAVASYNQAHPQGSQVDEAAYAALLSRFSPSLFAGINDPIRVNTNGAIVAPAVIQAGGAVKLNAKNDISSISVLKTARAVDGRSIDTTVGASQVPLVVVNSQLPSDHAQQQVNPLTLPGFALPSGQNGLFRLSGQGSSTQQVTQANTAPQNWSIGGAQVGAAQRQQTQPDVQARNVQVGDSAPVIATDRQLSQASRQAIASGAGASVINVASPGDNGNSVLQLPGHNSNSSAIAQMDTVQVAAAQQPVVAVIPGGTPMVPAIATAPVSGAATGLSSLSRVQGLPDMSGKSNPQKYLIETNPVLTELKQFMSSDYLLSNLGYDPDNSAKRLGDGFYEQKLIQQAVVARTGQRFIDGQNSDEGLYKYLMDNAIKSKQELNLAVGVTLTSQQVAALTHDIVWLEEHEVNGEKVLVPVLYLAQATGRLAPNGALIQGSDVTLIAGKDLNNSGTLRASNNLSAMAGNDLVNSGLVEAGNRLDLLAGNNIVNKSGGIISGRDVSLNATRGDVINQRDVTHLDSSYGASTRHRDILDSAARIEASNNMSIGAGRDINNNASVISSGADMKLSAGRDVNVNAIAERTTDARGNSYLSQQITQHGATVTTGRDLSISAGRDISAIASKLESKRDMALAAGEDIHLESAANESEFASRSKKKTLETRSVSQQSTELKAGRDISIDAGKDLDVIASRITAGGDVALDAAQDMTIASAKDESSYYYSKKSKGSFGSSSSKQVESYDSTNVASVVEAGKDLTINASKSADGAMNINGGRDVTIIGSQLKAHDDLMVAAQGDVAVLSGVEEHGSYSKKTKSGFLGLSKSGKSELKTTASQVGSELEAGNDVVVAAGNDIRLRASEATAGNDVELHAGVVNKDGDINLVSANDTAYSRSEQYKKKTGLSVSGGFISISSAKAAGKEAQSSTSVGSQVTADRDASLQAERDINISGSGVKAGRNVALNAGRDVNVVAAQNSSAEQDWKKDKRAGIGVSGDDNGVSMFIGAERTKEKNRLEQQTAAASQISAGQDLAINAKRDINQVGSDLKASHDINLAAGRNINIDAARESQLIEQQRESERNGLGMTLNHNYGNTKNAVSGAGKGEDNVSKGSSTLKAVDSVGQFLSGPTADVKFGNSKQSNSQQVVEQTNRSSTLSAGNDLNLSAGNDVQVRGAQLDAGRDINIKGRDLVLDAAKGSVSQETRESQSWGGIHGGTSGGFKVGVGGSHGVASGDSSQGTSTVTQLGAGRDVNLQASNDLNLIGTQVKAGRDIDLKAGNELNIRSAQNGYSSENNRSSGGGEVGLTFGSEGVGVYASVSLGKGNLEREGERQQEAYLYAGDRLGFTSGKDTNVSGATLRGDEVVGRVGGDLNVSSAADTGTVKGKEFDINVTVTVGPGAGVSGSVGYGATTGKTNWVDQQTSITGKEKVDIRTENHTQIDGALIAADNGNLKLDTGTLGFSDIAGKDKEHGYYLNVGGSYNQSGSGGTAQDPSQTGKGEEGKTGWSVSGWNYEKDREQIVRATVGAGDIIVRKDAETGGDSTQGLNRDVGKAYEVTKDKESRTDLYASGTSVGAVLDPGKTYDQWERNVSLYGENSEEALRSQRQYPPPEAARLWTQGGKAIPLQQVIAIYLHQAMYTALVVLKLHRESMLKLEVVKGEQRVR